MLRTRNDESTAVPAQRIGRVCSTFSRLMSRQGSSADKNGTGDVLPVSVFGTPIISFISTKGGDGGELSLCDRALYLYRTSVNKARRAKGGSHVEDACRSGHSPEGSVGTHGTGNPGTGGGNGPNQSPGLWHLSQRLDC